MPGIDIKISEFKIDFDQEFKSWSRTPRLSTIEISEKKEESSLKHVRKTSSL